MKIERKKGNKLWVTDQSPSGKGDFKKKATRLYYATLPLKFKRKDLTPIGV